MTSRHTIMLFILLTILTVVCLMSDLLIGSADITLSDIWRMISGDMAASEPEYIIFSQSRLPKAITAILAGAALPVAGLMMQTFFRNPVAGPDILGVSAGSSLFVAIVMLAGTSVFSVFQFNSMAIVLAAIAGAIVVLLVILLVASRIRDAMTLLIFGIMFGMAISAIVGVLQYYSDRGALKLFMLWTFGSLSGVTWSQLYILIPLITGGLITAMFLSKALNLLLLGEYYAQSLGLHARKARYGIILLTALLTGSVTAFCGPIAFIGIAIPHLARMVFRLNDHKILIPGSALMGMAVMLICDMLTQLPGDTGLLPLNSITAFMGAPFVVFIIWKHQHVRKTF